MDIETFFDSEKLRGDYLLMPSNAGLDLHMVAGDVSGSPLTASGAGAPLQNEHDLKTAVLISLFTDRRANEDDALPDFRGSKGGWWADALNNQKIGSRLWLLHREKQLNQVVLRAKEYAEEALQWLLDDGVVEQIIVTAEITRSGVLGLHIAISKTKRQTADFKFEFAWRGVGNLEQASPNMINRGYYAVH